MNRYEAFLKVVEVGSFTKAAEILGYTQSAMSQMIASLENELSVAAKTFIRFLIMDEEGKSDIGYSRYST